MLMIILFPFPDRFQVPSWTPEKGFIPNFAIRGGFYFYPFRNSKDHAWNVSLGADITLFSNGKQNFGFLVDMEFIADPNSPIFFQPRAIYFAEAFYISTRNLVLAYYHRCKHDVDGLGRTLILSGIKAMYLVNDELTFSFNVYPIRYDRTYPKEFPRIDMEKLFGSLGIMYGRRYGNFSYRLLLQMDVYSYGVRTNYMGELRYIFVGKKGNMNIFSVLERYYDTGMNAYSSSATLFRIGIGADTP